MSVDLNYKQVVMGELGDINRNVDSIRECAMHIWEIKQDVKMVGRCLEPEGLNNILLASS